MQEERATEAGRMNSCVSDYTHTNYLTLIFVFQKYWLCMKYHVMWALHISYPIMHCACSTIHIILSASEIYMYQLSPDLNWKHKIAIVNYKWANTVLKPFMTVISRNLYRLQSCSVISFTKDQGSLNSLPFISEQPCIVFCSKQHDTFK